MNYNIINEFIRELQLYENLLIESTIDLKSFVNILHLKNQNENTQFQNNWKNQEKGRSADIVINTLIVHLSKYAKNYSKSIIKIPIFLRKMSLFF